MDIDKLNKWLSLGANLGIILGLVLLVIEIRQNTDTMRSEMSQARTNNRVDSYYNRAFSDYWPRLMASMKDYPSISAWYDSLSDEDYERMRLFYLGVVNENSNTAYQCEQGYLDTQQCESMRAQLVRILPHLPYVLFNLEADGGPFFQVLQELGANDDSLPLLLDDGSWMLPRETGEQPFGPGLGRPDPRISGVRDATSTHEE